MLLCIHSATTSVLKGARIKQTSFVEVTRQTNQLLEIDPVSSVARKESICGQHNNDASPHTCFVKQDRCDIRPLTALRQSSADYHIPYKHILRQHILRCQHVPLTNMWKFMNIGHSIPWFENPKLITSLGPRQPQSPMFATVLKCMQLKNCHPQSGASYKKHRCDRFSEGVTPSISPLCPACKSFQGSPCPRLELPVEAWRACG